MRTALLVVMVAAVLHGATHYVTVAGLGGEPDYELRFATQAQEVDKLFRSLPGENKVHTLHGRQATREKLRGVLAQVAAEAAPGDELVLTLIGHGSFDGREYKFNLPGPDISSIELASLCDRVPARRQLIVNTTSASGGSLPALQKPGRALVSATKSGTEKNATVFARYWIEALRDPGADTDKNGAVSALEAFRYADRKTVAFYESMKRLATEHALLEDTGAGEGVRDPGAANGQGLLAARFTLSRTDAGGRQENPKQRDLYAKKEKLEEEIDRLKYEKAAMPLEEYRKKLSVLLLQLAEVQEAIDR